MVWQFNEHFPIYRQVVLKLKGAILRGDYKPGDTLPTVRSLAADAGLNPNTAQRALTTLEDIGLATCYSTAGRKVTTDLTVIEKQRELSSREIVVQVERAISEIGLTREEFIKILSEEE